LDTAALRAAGNTCATGPLVVTSKKGVRSMCPAFVSDCLETIEEIGMRGRRIFLNAGGAEFTLISCLNDHPIWIDALEKMVTNAFTSSERVSCNSPGPIVPATLHCR
jgi:hypothetical protein